MRMPKKLKCRLPFPVVIYICSAAFEDSEEEVNKLNNKAAKLLYVNPDEMGETLVGKVNSMEGASVWYTEESGNMMIFYHEQNLDDYSFVQNVAMMVHEVYHVLEQINYFIYDTHTHKMDSETSAYSLQEIFTHCMIELMTWYEEKENGE